MVEGYAVAPGAARRKPCGRPPGIPAVVSRPAGGLWRRSRQPATLLRPCHRSRKGSHPALLRRDDGQDGSDARRRPSDGACLGSMGENRRGCSGPAAGCRRQCAGRSGSIGRGVRRDEGQTLSQSSQEAGCRSSLGLRSRYSGQAQGCVRPCNRPWGGSHSGRGIGRSTELERKPPESIPSTGRRLGGSTGRRPDCGRPIICRMESSMASSLCSGGCDNRVGTVARSLSSLPLAHGRRQENGSNRHWEDRRTDCQETGRRCRPGHPLGLYSRVDPADGTGRHRCTCRLRCRLVARIHSRNRLWREPSRSLRSLPHGTVRQSARFRRGALGV